MKLVTQILINVGVFCLSCAKQLSGEDESWNDWLRRVKILD